jgi:phosphatidylserine/phosphatidylglycerophosphate/cardiolipin synthase-like enzyme
MRVSEHIMTKKNLVLLILTAILLTVSLPVFAAEIAPAQLFDSLFSAKKSQDTFCRLLTDNNKSWYARWHVIDNAKKTLDISYFIVEPDVFGMSMLGLLKKKAADGVKIRLMMDARGTKGLTRTMMGQDYLQELLENPNIEVHTFNPISSRLLKVFKDVRHLTGSNHDKIIIADGEWVITGGRNIAHHYFADPKDDPAVYRDTDVLFRGKYLGSQMKTAFDEEFVRQNNTTIARELFGNWKNRSKELEFYRRAMQRWMTGRGLFKDTIPEFSGVLKKVNGELSHLKQMQSYASFRPFEGQRAFPAGILDKHDFSGTRNDITDNICRFIDGAQKEIIIQNPYVVLTEKAREALIRASARGVKIIIHTNSPVSTDSLLTQAFFVKDWKEVMASMPTLQIFAFKGERKLHAKVFVFDGIISVVGTYNMDYISEQVNSEVVSVIKSPTFARRLIGRIAEDIKQSVEYKVQVQKDGSIKVIYGPSIHSPKKVMDRLRMLGKLGMIKFLI